MNYFKSFFGIHETAHTNILITYGSQTGCAKGIAEYIYKNKIQVYTKTIKCLNDVILDNILKFNIIIILLSTTGDGEFPENSVKFWRKIRKRNELLPINYILCGFGSYDYNNFCHSSKCLDRKLKRLGANKLIDTTFINNEDQEDIEYFIDTLQEVCDEFINTKQNDFIKNITKN